MKKSVGGAGGVFADAWWSVEGRATGIDRDYILEVAGYGGVGGRGWWDGGVQETAGVWPEGVDLVPHTCTQGRGPGQAGVVEWRSGTSGVMQWW